MYEGLFHDVLGAFRLALHVILEEMKELNTPRDFNPHCREA